MGIHDGHTAGACVLEDGRVLACISEERLNRIKEWAGFPALSIQKCLEITSKKPEDFDAIGLCSLLPQIGHSVYSRPHILKRIFGIVARVAPHSFLQDEARVKVAQNIGRTLTGSRRRGISSELERLGFSCPQTWYEHHHLHAATAFYTNWYRPEPTLVVTLDGSGDAVCATVSIGEKGNLRRIASVFNYNSICEFYTRVTQYLGMKPMSHEYKVMGMAPYADRKYSEALLNRFREYFKVHPKKPLQFINDTGLCRWQFLDLFKDVLYLQRFDNISGAIQDLFEDVCLNWIGNAIRETGIKDLALSGGGFMNVKLNARVLNDLDINSLFIFPSCGDESNPIGAAILAALDKGFSPGGVDPVTEVYWGPEYSNSVVKAAIDKALPQDGWEVSFYEDIDRFVGREVAAGKIIGRLRGRMEWGARALGNRSIVADPRSPQVILRINKAIKMRDFWMPFAPAILDSAAPSYVVIKEGFRCPFMVMAFATTRRGRSEIVAGTHPFDSTARAQIVNQEDHPAFYQLIKGFEEASGVGGILNTSFNLHGDPIACSPEDALYTFINSDLDGLQMENYYITRGKR
jgi:carbamoyltransferase